jgi:hypothetical protein
LSVKKRERTLSLFFATLSNLNLALHLPNELATSECTIVDCFAYFWSMNEQKDNTRNFLAAIFFVVFILFFSVAADNSNHYRPGASNDVVLVGSHTIHPKAVIFESYSMPSFHKSCIFIQNNFLFNLFHEGQVLSVEKHRINELILILRKERLTFLKIFFSPLLVYHSSDRDDTVPILS